MDFSKTSAVVSGGASGLGEATARRLVELGSKVVIADMNEDRGASIEKELGDAVKFVKTDVSKGEQVEAAVAAAAKMGPLRVAVSCAGLGWAKRILSKEGEPHEQDFFAKVINVNLIGTFNVLRLGAAAMAKNEPLEHGERGVIVNTASVAAFEGQIGQIAYAASKGGVAAMTIPAARDLMKVGIRVCTIAPGIFDTAMLAQLPDDVRESLAAGVPFPKRLGQPEEYARLVQHICENGYLNGEIIRIDGALRMQPR